MTWVLPNVIYKFGVLVEPCIETSLDCDISKVDGLYVRMPTPLEKSKATTTTAAASTTSTSISGLSHSIIFRRQKKKDSGYGSQGHLKLELVNQVNFGKYLYFLI